MPVAPNEILIRELLHFLARFLAVNGKPQVPQVVTLTVVTLTVVTLTVIAFRIVAPTLGGGNAP